MRRAALARKFRFESMMSRPTLVILAVIGGLVLVMLSAFWLLVAETGPDGGQIRVNWVDTLWRNDSARGEGVEVVFAADRKHPDGIGGFYPFLAQLCPRVAALAIAHVEDKLGKRDPDYVAVAIRVGSTNFGMIVREYFRFDGQVCRPYK